MKRFFNWRGLLWKLWYPILTSLTRNSSVVFLNYGYSSDSRTATPLLLATDDEPNRSCIQLYDHVARAVELTRLDVLEVSCGHGGGASYIARYLNPKSVHGIDRNPKAIMLCKRRHKSPSPTFSCGDAMALTFPGGTFDAVINIEASHCYPSLPGFLAEALRVLRPGGYFLYADFRDKEPDLALLHRQVEESGFELVRHEDLSADVVRGMRLNTERYRELIRRLIPRLLRGPAINFAGLEGSTIYQSLESGQTVYFFYVLRKPRKEVV